MNELSNAGRPLKFKNAEELQEKIDEYFRKCDEHTRELLTKQGDLVEIREPKPYTISGLAYHLGTTRRTLLDYEERGEEYSHTVRAAKAKIEQFVEESLWTPKIASGVMFNLKNNFNWKDKTENKIEINTHKLTDEEINELLDDEH